MTVHFIWGCVVVIVTAFASTSFDQWLRRRYPAEQSVFKRGQLELRVTDSEQLLPLAQALAMIPEKNIQSDPQTSPEANA